MSEGVGASELWVCWVLPLTEPDERSPILSFLPPGLEDRIGRRRRGPFVLARETDQTVRDEARRLYLEVVARIGLAPIGRTRTLRAALAPPGKGSRWWYHLVSFRDCEREVTFQRLLALLTIQAVAAQYGVTRLVLVGAPVEIASALRSAFEVRAMRSQRCRPLWLDGILALARRALFFVRTARLYLAVHAWKTGVPVPAEVALCGFWDWSVHYDEQHKGVCDRYFQLLPDCLRKQSCSLLWFVWLDPSTDLRGKRRPLKEALATLRSCQDVVLLHSFLRAWEIMREAANLRPLLSYGCAAASSTFRSIFAVRGLDLFPLFAAPLLEGFLGPGLPACVLMETAMARAAAAVRPRAIVSFLEHFPLARAQYEGYRQSGCGGTTIAMQHASFSREKTFMFLHPTYEFRGEPDGYAVPTPDLVCAMGTQGRELFLECGYSDARVLVTGSTRYDHVRVEPGSDHGRCGGPNRGVTVLVVVSHAVDQEIDLLEALCSATEGMAGVVLRLRPHPLSKVDAHPRFKSLRDRFIVVGGPLNQNLLQSDLVVFTYSTVAEEVLLKGTPVWQWLPRQFNGSALAEAFPTIPRFGSVAGLRQALQDFQANPARFLPSEDLKRAVCERLFFRDDGQAGARVASVVVKVVHGLAPA